MTSSERMLSASDLTTSSHDMVASPIAIVGISALFPGSVTAHDFWRNVLAGKALLSDIPSTHWLEADYYHPEPTSALTTYARCGGFVPEVDFDPLQFGLVPNALPTTDPVQLLSLVTAQQLLQDVCSVQTKRVDLGRTSVVLGAGTGTALVAQMQSKLQRPVWVKAMRESGLPESQINAICQRLTDAYPAWTESTFPGLLSNVIAGRIANRFDLGGTNCVVDAACASSLAAIAIALQELRTGAADLCLTGGVDALNDIFMYMCFTKTPALSPTNDCRPFAADADGTMIGEGLGMLALRRLADAERDGDRIYAVIRGLGSSSDGRAKSVYAPRPAGQSKAIQRAYEQAGYPPQEVELVEAHGTATVAGDATELEGLHDAFGDSNSDGPWCALGSVKSQIGHTKAAAGAASLVKAALALHHKILPPTIKVNAPNPEIDWTNSPFYLNTESRPWIHAPTSTRKAAVSSFGFGGSNFHVTLEEYTGPEGQPPRLHHVSSALFVFSAGDPDALAQQIQQTETALQQYDLAYVARISQQRFQSDAPVRLACMVQNKDAFWPLAQRILKHIQSQPDSRFVIPYQAFYHPFQAWPKIAFLFPGQGSQYVNMGRDLAMEFDAARQVWDQTAELSWQASESLFQVVFALPTFDERQRQDQEIRLRQTDWAQPAIGALCVSHLSMLAHVGVEAHCVAGHSYGELPALFAAGVLPSTQDLLQLSRMRGELMRDTAAPYRAR